jgi:hypothetical protein
MWMKTITILLISASANAQTYPIPLIVGWDNPSENTDDSQLTDLESTRIVCDRDGVQFIDTLQNSVGNEGNHQTMTFTITMDGIVQCWGFAINAEDESSVISNEFIRKYGTPLTPKPITGFGEE